MKKLIGVLAAATLALTACGSDSGGDKKSSSDGGDLSASEQTTADSVASELTKQGLSEDQASCIADGMVGTFGVDKLTTYGLLNDDGSVASGSNITSGDFSTEDAEKAATVFTGCVHFSDMLTLSGLGEQLTDDQMACLNDKIDDEAFKKMMVGIMSGDSSAAAGVGADMASCATATP